MRNEELVKRYQNTGDRSLLDALCTQNAGLVGLVVKRLRWIYAAESAKTAAVTESDDLMQEGFIHLVKAARDFRPEQGAKFSTFATKYIYTGIFNAVRKDGAVTIPAYRKEQLLKLRDLREKVREPSEMEIAAYLGIRTESVPDLLQLEANAEVVSLEKPIADGMTIAETVAAASDPIEAAEDGIFDEQMRVDVWKAVDDLDDQKRDILRRQYGNGESLSDIGRSMHLDRDKVYRLRNAAFAELRRNGTLREYAEQREIALSRAYYGGLSSYNRTRTSATEKSALVLVEEGAKIRRRMTKAERDAYFRELERQQRQEITDFNKRLGAMQ